MNERQSNFELVRIIAMLLIVLFHCNYYSIGEPTPYDFAHSPINAFFRVLCEQICVIGVNLFVLISGWFGIKPSIKGFCSLLFQIVFWGSIAILTLIACKASFNTSDAIKYFYFGSTLWFVPEYLTLYVISPILNTFIANSSSKQQLIILSAFFSIEFIYAGFKDMASFNTGYSSISFVGLYLLARFMNQHQKLISSVLNTMKLFFIYITSVIIPIVIFLITKHKCGQFYYSSPFAVLASASLLFYFSTLNIKSKAINWISCSTFSIYIFHMHPCISPFFKELTSFHFQQLNLLEYSLFSLLLTIVLFLICIPIDKFRITCWNFVNNIKHQTKKHNSFRRKHSILPTTPSLSVTW